MSAEAWPEDAQYPPSGQGSQTVELRFALKLPGSHGGHASPAPSRFEYDPGEHGMQFALLAEPLEGR